MVTYMAKMSNLCTAQQVNCSQTAVLGVLYLTGALNACMKRKIQRSMLSTVTLNYFGAPTLFEPILSTPTSLTEFLHFPDLICYNPWEDEVLCSIYVKVRWEGKKTNGGEKTKQKNLHNNSSISWVVFSREERVEREQSCVLFLDEGVVTQAADIRFTDSQWWKPALHSLLSMEKLILPILNRFLFIWLFSNKCQRRSQKTL